MSRIQRFTAAILCLSTLLGSQAQAADWLYTFRPDDNIWNLCLKYTKQPECWLSLPKLNHVTKAEQIKPGFVLRIPVGWLKETPRPVEVTFVTGQATLKETKDAEAKTLTTGDLLPIGSVINTLEGTINLRFGDGSTMTLEPNSELTFDALSSMDGYGVVDSHMRLNQGAVKTRVVKRTPKSRYTIATPVAVAAVRGTEYRVSSTASAQAVMRGEVFEGLVDINTRSEVQPVKAGFGIVAHKGSPIPKPKPLLPAPEFSVDASPQLLPRQVAWSPQADAHRYQLEVLKADEQLVQRLSLTANQHRFDALTPGCYQLRLRGIDADQLQGLPSVQDLCVAAPLGIAQLMRKGTRYTTRFTAEVHWAPVPEAAQYRVQVATDAHFKNIIRDEKSQTTQLIVSSKEPLYFRVQTIGQEQQVTAFSQTLAWEPGVSPWTALGSFLLMILIL